MGASPKDAPPREAKDGDEASDGDEDKAVPIAEDAAERWLKDTEGRLDSVTLGRLMSDALAALSGTPGRGGQQVGTFVIGDVHMGSGSRIGGDTVGGDRISGDRARTASPGVRREPTGRIDPAVLADVLTTFTAPPAWDAMTAALTRQRVLILRTPPGAGARTAALRLLAGEEGAREVHRLDPDSDLRDLGLEARENVGYLIDGLSLDQAGRLRPFLLDGFAKTLGDHRCRLVITVDAELRMPHGIDDYVMPAAPPSGRAIVHSHLTHALGDSMRAEQMLVDPPFPDILEELAKEDFSARRLVSLARGMAAVANGEETLDDLRARVTEQSAADFESWFDAIDDRGLRTFVIALAVLNGLPHHVVAATATDLEAMVAAVERPPLATRRSVFGSTRSHRMIDARAERFDDEESTGHGRARVEAVRFRHRDYPAWVLDRVWREYDGVHSLLIEWLRGLGVHSNPAVRIRAAAAIGFVSRHSFAYARSEILLPWATSAMEREREAAVAAVHICAADPSLTPIVLTMVRTWGQPSRSRMQRWTAARTWGAGVGRAHPGRALNALRLLAGTNDWFIAEAISMSMTELFISPERDTTADVLDTLITWTGFGNPSSAGIVATTSRRTTGILCFIQLVHDVRIEAEDDGVSWPALLWLSGRSDDDLDRIATLWRRALVAPHLSRIAIGQLRTWVRRAERDPALRPALMALLVAVARGDDADRTVEVLRHHLTQWGRGKKSAPSTTRALLEVLGHPDSIDWSSQND